MKKKINVYFFVIIGIAILISAFCIIRNPYFLIGLFISGLYLFDNRHRIKPALVSVGVSIIISHPFIFLTEYLIGNTSFDFSHELTRFLISAIVACFILIIPFYFIYNFLLKVIIVANYEKDNYNIVNRFPDLICTVHRTKTKQFSLFGFKGVHCRISKKCNIKNNIKALQLVGLIGGLNDGEEYKNGYYVTLWDYKNKKIIEGDYDVIEIHESEKISDYNSVISKVVSNFYNELNRYKPINEVTVRIIGNPDISESTKRMLEKYFLKIEYASNN